MNQPKTKVKRINIYLTQLDKKELNDIKYTYKLSFSTICDIIVHTLMVEDEFAGLEKYHVFENEPKRDNQTSIKPRNILYVCEKYPNAELVILYTNLVKIYLRDLLKKYLTEKKTKRIKNDIYKQFTTTKDPNWDGNEWNRRLPKYLKQNKSYYKKILEEM